MKYQWNLEGHQILFKKYFQLEEYAISHDLYAGGKSQVFTREIFERGSVVALLPYDPAQRKVVLIEQFRVGALEDEHSPWLWESVAGVIESGETADDVAIRESHEEAGCEIRKLHRICQYYVSPGGTTEKCTLYCGIVDSEGVGGIHGLPDENEDIRVEVVDVEEAYRWLDKGIIKSSATIIALQWLRLNESYMDRLYGF
ncbi:MAG: NUDIX domain-containing protein [Gammaproteobacteria bacterium]|nr:NUDIX domain-containing protein [Gammaproteobacteria bacterium]